MTQAARPNDFVPEIEQSLLGALLMGDGYGLVRSIVRDEHFVSDIHRHLFVAIATAHDRFGSTRADLVVKLVPEHVDQSLRARENVPLSRYIGALIANTSHAGRMVEQAAKHVVEQWARLSAAEELELATAAARDPSSDVIAIARRVGSALEDILGDMRRFGGRRTRQSIGQAAEGALEAARLAMEKGGGLTGLSWGFADVNRLTGGMQRKDLTLVAARPSMGKTSLMTSSALAAARAGHGVAILSLEMDAEKLTARALSELTFGSTSPIAYNDIIQGRIDRDQFERLQAAQRRLAEMPIAIDDGQVSTFDIRVKIETMLEQFERARLPRLECVMVDHLGWVKPSAHYRGNRNNEVGEITRALKEYAKEFDIAVVLLSQLSRQVEGRDDKRPQLSDLRDSGNIEQDADTAVFLYRESYYLERERRKGEADADRLVELIDKQHKLEFVIAKQRNGPITTVDLFCDMAFSAVRNGDRYRT